VSFRSCREMRPEAALTSMHPPARSRGIRTIKLQSTCMLTGFQASL
jgi:hypothetical protein